MSVRTKARKVVAKDPERVMSQQDWIDAYYRGCHEVVLYWKTAIEDRQLAVGRVAAKCAEHPGGIAEVMRWGTGIEEDLFAKYAYQALGALAAGHRDVQGILEYQLDEIVTSFRHNSFRIGSSSPFANAVMTAAAEVAREYAEKCRYWLDSIRDFRAMAEDL